MHGLSPLHVLIVISLCFIFLGLSHGTFVGLSVLRELHLSHNLLQSIEENNILGLEELHVLALDHNRLTSLPADLFTRLAKLRILNLHHNHLSTLQPVPGSGHAALQRVSLQHNRWACSTDTDCHWITLTLDTFNKTAIADLSEVYSELSTYSESQNKYSLGLQPNLT